MTLKTETGAPLRPLVINCSGRTQGSLVNYQARQVQTLQAVASLRGRPVRPNLIRETAFDRSARKETQQ